MRPILRLLILPLALTLLSQTGAAGQGAPSEKSPAAEADAARFGGQRRQGGRDASEGSRHRQKIIQRRSSEKVRTGTHDSEIQADPPPDVFESPEAKSADHIPEPLPSDEVQAVQPQKPPPAAAPARRGPGKMEQAWKLYNRGRYAPAAELFAEVVSSAPRQALNARLGLAYCRLKQGRRPAAVDQLEQSSNAIQNFNQQNNQR